MKLTLHDTLTRTIKPLKPQSQAPFKMYCCGPTVYGPAHIGNFRTFLLQDVLRRVLEVQGHEVLHVRNITDVDDKTIRASQKENTSLEAFTKYWTDQFHKDCRALNLLPPRHEPKATEHIEKQIELIQKLINESCAYVSPDGSVYFRISSFPYYGKLSHIDLHNTQTQSTNSAESTNLADEYDREQISDFALWKAHKSEDGPNYWESPWGKGRPGWHIECSAMALEYLDTSFDLHAGGIDLCFPHHENEIAQAEAATHKNFAKHWFHSAHLMVEGQKMSKSLGNLFTLQDILQDGFSAMDLRYVLISGHYKQPLNFTQASLHAATKALDKLRKYAQYLLELSGIDQEAARSLHPTTTITWSIFKPTWDALLNDLNTPEALGHLFSSLHAIKTNPPQYPSDALKQFINIMYALGLDVFPQATPSEQELQIPEAILALAQKRWDAKKAKNFSEADSLRKHLEEQGWIILDGKDTYKLEPIKGN